MNRWGGILYEHFKLLFSPVIVNAYVFYDEQGRVRHENWGDDINYYFLRDIVKHPLVLFNRTSFAFRFDFKNYLLIGSTIDMLCKLNTEVWGAGIINGSAPLKVKPKKVYAVRGPLSRKKLIEEGVECPEVYGDPALLTACYYRPNCEKRYRYGFVSHVSNRYFIEKFKIDGKLLTDCSDVLLIDLRYYRHWHDIIDQICSCEAILSSSLHGLIIAEAYHVPNIWIEFGDPLIGGHFKFHDFFLSIHRDREAPVIISGTEIPINRVDLELSKWERGVIDLLSLLKACPFRVKDPIYTVYNTYL